MNQIKEPTSYLSTSEGSWRVIHQGLPLCRDGTEPEARACAKRFNVDISHRLIWDGDLGRFIKEKPHRR